MINQNKKRILKWAAGIFAALILIISAAAVFLSAKWKPLLTEKIKSGVYNGSHHLYKIDFKNINLNLLTGSLALNDVTLTPDSAVYDSLKIQRLAPAHTFQLKLKKIQISNLGILTAYFKKRADVKSITLNQPSINMVFSKVPKEKDTVKTKKSLFDQISKTFKSLRIRNIRIVDTDFDYINKSGAVKTVNSIKHLNINVNDFLLDSLSANDTTRFYYTKDVSFEIAGYKSNTKDKMYTMKIDTIRGSAASKRITIMGFRLKPLYPELTFARKYKTQKDRYDLTFKKIQFNGVDFIGLNTDQKLHAKSLIIGPANVEVFMSRESAAPAGLDKARNFPHMALKRLKIQTLIDTVKLKSVDVKYSEYNPASKKTGSVIFRAVHGNILNVTNDSLRLIKQNHAVADLSTSLMGKAQLNLNINFNLTDKNGAFSYGGSLNNFDFKNLNPLSTALGLVEIESGFVQHIDFKATGNTRSASGSLNMIYKNLNVKLLSDNIDGEGTKKKGFLSFLANSIIVKDQNPENGKAPRVATMTNTRINSASFFNLMWKTIFVGIRDIVGIGFVPVKDPVKQQKTIAKKVREQRKQDKKEAAKTKKSKN